MVRILPARKSNSACFNKVMQRLILGSEAKTAALAAGLADLLEPGDAVFLSGQLGAGKTFFIRAAARALGVEEPVTSPSFTMAQSYSGRVPVHHLDLYRLAHFTADDAIDFEPFFEPEAITFIEWPEQAEPFLDQPAVVIELEHVDETSRRISFIRVRDDLRKAVEDLIASARD